jgi:hypothetical protein
VRGDALNQLPTTTAVQRDALPLRSVEEVFHSGLLVDVVRAPSSQINTRIDAFFDLFMDLPLFETPIEISTWGKFGAEANYRRSVSEAFLGQTLQEARAFVASAPGRFLARALPFENRERQNDTHELLYFRDSGIHRRLIERTVTFDRGQHYRLDTDALECLRAQQIESYVPKRWEAFVVTTVIDLVGDRCDAFAYRHEETREIDLVLEWNDRGSPERWAIEVASRKFNTHPSRYFAEECQYLGVQFENCYIVRRANGCDGGARGRGGVHAISLPRMVDCLRQRMRR